MRAIYTQFSALVGLLAFLNQLWSYAPLDRAILIGFGTGLGIYLLMILGDLVVNRILAYSPPAMAEGRSAAGSNTEKSGRAKQEHEAKAA